MPAGGVDEWLCISADAEMYANKENTYKQKNYIYCNLNTDTKEANMYYSLNNFSTLMNKLSFIHK